jgi:hypothetical protein
MQRPTMSITSEMSKNDVLAMLVATFLKHYDEVLLPMQGTAPFASYMEAQHFLWQRVSRFGKRNGISEGEIRAGIAGRTQARTLREGVWQTGATRTRTRVRATWAIIPVKATT